MGELQKRKWIFSGRILEVFEGKEKSLSSREPPFFFFVAELPRWFDVIT